MYHCSFCNVEVSSRRKYCDDCRDTGAPWRVDDVNLAKACDHFNLTARVVVKRTATRKLLGRYHGIKIPPDAPRDPAVVALMSDDELDALMNHLITISARMTPEAASRTIWHELTHAMQYERDPDYYATEYARELAEAKRLVANGVPYIQAYRMISFEVEAKANEELHYTKFPLTLANKRVNMPMLKRPHSRISHAVNGVVIDGEFAEETERYTLRSIETAKQMLR